VSSLKGFGSTLSSAYLVAGLDRQIDDRVPGALVRRSLHGYSAEALALNTVRHERGLRPLAPRRAHCM
jgi:hypothetical protein